MSAVVAYVATLAGWSALQLAWQGTLVLGLFLAVSHLLGRAHPSIRHALAGATLVLLAALPLVTALVTHVMLVHDAARGAANVTGPITTGLSQHAGVAALFDRWTPAIRWLLVVWVAGAAWGALRLFAGTWRLSRGRAQCPVDSTGTALTTTALVARLAGRLGLRATPRVQWSSAVASPGVHGLGRATLVLPGWLPRALSADELEAVLLHELAHVRRRDYAVNLLQCGVEIGLWWHPAVRVVSAAIRAEREHCCDEEAAAVSGQPVVLATALVHLADHARAPAGTVLAAHGGRLTRRVQRLLDAAGHDFAAASRRAPTRTTRAAGQRAPRATTTAYGGVAFLTLLIGAVAVAGGGTPAPGSETLTLAGIAAHTVPARVVTLEAADPAGPFTLRLVNGRVSSLRLAGQRVARNRLRLARDTLRVRDSGGLRIAIDPRGAIRWQPRRPTQGPPSPPNPDVGATTQTRTPSLPRTLE